VEFSGNDGEGRGDSREAVNCMSEGKSSPGCRVYRRRGGAGGRMVLETNVHRSRCHGKGNQDLCQIKEVVER